MTERGASPRLRLWLERARDGYRLRDAATNELVRSDDPRIRVIKVAGVSYRLDALQDDAFAPGRRLALVPEPDNEHDPNAVGVWDDDRRLQAGYVPAEVARNLVGRGLAGGLDPRVLRRRPARRAPCSARTPRRLDRTPARVIHEIPLERRTLHGHFSRDLPPILTIDSGDAVAFACLDAGWHVTPADRFEPREAELDDGHALIGPFEIRGAQAGQTLEVRIDEVRVGSWGATFAAGWPSPLNDYLGLADGETCVLRWSLDAAAGTGRDEQGREVDLRPFAGVLGMPPAEPGVHSTGPPRPCGGNIDCTELVAGTKLFLPIPVDGALFSAGDGHARQGDGEVSQTAIECGLDRLQLTLDGPRRAAARHAARVDSGSVGDVRLRRRPRLRCSDRDDERCST